MKEVIIFLKRFKWQEAKKVELETLVNLFATGVCYSYVLTSIVILFWGIWWHLIWALPVYVLGVLCLNDTRWGNESALAYLRRVFAK